MTFLNHAKLYLTPLSPIHIGCGEDFDPTNYVIEKGVLYGFDPSLAELPEALRTRLTQLGEGANLLGIQGFFREHRQHFIPHAHVLMPVAAGLADRCTLQLAYAIGVAQPLSIYADLHETGKVDTAALEKVLMDVMSLSPRGIREHLKLNKPIYARTSAFGHFGREPDAEGGFSWEKIDNADKLKSHFA